MNANADRRTFCIANHEPYRLSLKPAWRTPALLVFRGRVRRNLTFMRNYLESVAPGSGYAHLCAHVKTHKSSAVLQEQVSAGIRSFKASLNEVDLLLKNGVPEAVVAYPLLEHDALRLARQSAAFPHTRIHVQAGTVDHVDILDRAAEEAGIHWSVFLDLDVGMHRTGISPESAESVAERITASSCCTFAGIHGYDGHNHHETETLRRDEAEKAMSRLLNIRRRLEERRIPVPRLIAGGSPAFLEDLKILFPAAGRDCSVQVSPGTWIYWDSKYDSLWPGAFEWAALIHARVMDLPGGNRITLNLGHKRWSVDQGPVHCFSAPGLEVRGVSEEHTVLSHPADQQWHIGDSVLIVPRHVCSTVNLYETCVWIDENGVPLNETCPVDGRNR